MNIEERAEKYAQSFRYLDMEDYDDGLRCGRNEGYVKGAKEQREIDVEKAIDWLKRELGYPMPYELFEQWCDEKLEDFRKAMKGE